MLIDCPAQRLLAGFERITVVNLPDRTDRRREMEEQLQAVGVEAHDARLRFFAAKRPTEKGDWPSLGARGCFQSHLEILRQALDDGLGNVLVLEDDCDFTPHLEEQREALLGALETASWDLCYPGHPEALADAEAGTWVAHAGSFQQSHCYAVHGRALPRLVEFLEAITRRAEGHPLGGPQHYDGALNMFRAQNPDIVTLLAAPSLAHQRSSKSDIFEHWYDRVPGVRQLFALRRQLKKRLRG
ncbi:MAG: glycosyltransferase family 25 protein [Planctomycetia bacterium]|nr:glycosyltransferase family 25 protein [Planctomycetia bacterium]